MHTFWTKSIKNSLACNIGALLLKHEFKGFLFIIQIFTLVRPVFQPPLIHNILLEKKMFYYFFGVYCPRQLKLFTKFYCKKLFLNKISWKIMKLKWVNDYKSINKNISFAATELFYSYYYIYFILYYYIAFIYIFLIITFVTYGN